MKGLPKAYLPLKLYILGHLKSIRGFLLLDDVDGHILGNTNPIVSNERASER